jgi:hypothetical protein
MKKLLALGVALFAATMSVALATETTITPGWLEELDDGTVITTAAYSTQRAVVEGSFTPQYLDSGVFLMAGDQYGPPDVMGLVTQGVGTNIIGQSVGIDRQLLEQSAYMYVAEAPPLEIDAENDAQATTLVMKINKDQSALYSGKLITDAPIDSQMIQTYDIGGPVDPDSGFPINDDPYSGGHLLQYPVYTQAGPSYVTTFNDYATLVNDPYTEDAVCLKEQVNDARVTISAAPVTFSDPNVFQIVPDSDCDGAGDFWKNPSDGNYLVLDPNGPYGHEDADRYSAPEGFVQEKVDGFAPAPESLNNAQLTEVKGSISSSVTLKDKETMILGNIIDSRTLAGSGGLKGEFENAILDPGQELNVDLDGDIDFSFDTGRDCLICDMDGPMD